MVSPRSNGIRSYILPPGSWQGAQWLTRIGRTLATKTASPGGRNEAAGGDVGVLVGSDGRTPFAACDVPRGSGCDVGVSEGS